ncbi:hypothetical protein PENSPDRAFT_672479 [Peniophora sp. CONT]|nr:hypothetical protein PENSPDRAFT_672479 [Peniophora sp. CONT]
MTHREESPATSIPDIDPLKADTKSPVQQDLKRIYPRSVYTVVDGKRSTVTQPTTIEPSLGRRLLDRLRSPTPSLEVEPKDTTVDYMLDSVAKALLIPPNVYIIKHTLRGLYNIDRTSELWGTLDAAVIARHISHPGLLFAQRRLESLLVDGQQGMPHTAIRLEVNTTDFQGGATYWVKGKEVDPAQPHFVPPQVCDENRQWLPSFCLYVQPLPGKQEFGKVWIQSLVGGWAEVKQGDVHPLLRDRKLSLLGKGLKPSWVQKDSLPRMESRRESLFISLQFTHCVFGPDPEFKAAQAETAKQIVNSIMKAPLTRFQTNL